MSSETTDGHAWLGFTDLLLAGVILLMVTGVVLGATLYLLPGSRLQIPEVQPGARVDREASFPVGASRLVNWGDQIVLVVRRHEHEYFAVQGISPNDGCILNWDAESMRIISPCTYVVYDVFGNAVVGLTTAPLRRYPVFVRAGAVYVTG